MNYIEPIKEFIGSTGFALIGENPLNLVMIAVACLLLYLAIVKKYEPLLLVPIAFGMLLTNLPALALTLSATAVSVVCAASEESKTVIESPRKNP